MRCPKCQYISFGTSDRCRNCGNEFLLPVEPAPIDLPIRSTDASVGPLADFALTERAPSAQPLAGSIGAGPVGVRRAAPNSGTSRLDLPLFIDGGIHGGVDTGGDAAVDRGVRRGANGGGRAADDAALVAPSAIPRTPLSVRRAQPTPTRPRLDRPLPILSDGDASGLPILRVGKARPDDGVFPRPAPLGTPAPAVLESASALARVLAGLVDIVVLATIDGAILLSTLRIVGLSTADVRLLPPVPLGVFLLLLNGGYLAIFTTAGGQTIGKMLARIRVVADLAGDNGESRASHEPVSLGASVLRASAYLVSLLPAGLGFAAILFDSDGRALHDRLAETRVVKA